MDVQEVLNVSCALYNMLGLNLDWEDGEGCLTHDYAYWRGGSSELKCKADIYIALFEHILSVGHSKVYFLLICMFLVYFSIWSL